MEQQFKPTERQLNHLFRSLSLATRPEALAKLQACIWDIWADSGDDKINLALQKGIAAQNSGDLAKARRIFGQIVWILPEFSEGYVRRASACLAMGLYKEALLDYKRALAVEPRRFDAMYGLAKIYLALFHEKPARAMLVRALQLAPHDTELEAHVRNFPTAEKSPF